MIKPTVGRIVWFYPPVDAHHSSTGVPHRFTSVTLLQDDDAKPERGRFAMWMPYQKGQAAKTEALEAKLGGAA